MTPENKKAYWKHIRERYRKAPRKEKKKILDEFCEVCSYNRKYAIRKLGDYHRQERETKKRGRAKEYKGKCITVVQHLWKLTRNPCGERLKEMLPLWLPAYEEAYGRLEEGVRKDVLRISATTIDRVLRSIRPKMKGRCTTKPGTLLGIPTRLSFRDIEEPGYLEADTVGHCGGSVAGDYIHTVSFTDIYSQWTELYAVWNKGYQGVQAGIKIMEQRLPVRIQAFDSDGGSEFLNQHLIRYWREEHRGTIEVTRSRPSHPNDNAHIEQKNWTHIRKLLGYQRFDKPELVPIINKIYTTWRLLQNYFFPNQKLIARERIGARIQKKHDTAKTPYHRLLLSNNVSYETKQYLQKTFVQLNPIKLLKLLDGYIQQLERMT